MANELNQYLDQVEFLNKLQTGNIQQFLPRKDTSFLRGGGLPQGLGIPKSRGGLESKLYNQRKPNVRRQIEDVGEERASANASGKEVKGGSNGGEETKNVLPEDTNRSVVVLSGTTGQTSSSSSSSTSMPSQTQTADGGLVAEPKPSKEEKQKETKEETRKETREGDTLGELNGEQLSTEEADKLLSSPEKRGKSFTHGSTRSVFFIPNDSSLPVQATKKRSDWKSILPKRVKISKIGVPIRFTKDGVSGRLFFSDLASYKKWKKKNKDNNLD